MRAYLALAAVLIFIASLARADESPYAWRQRATPMRHLLAAAIAHREVHAGRYPATLAELNVAEVDPGWLATLVYRPQPAEGVEERAAGSAVLFHESLSSSDRGAWVAFADGRLEFVRDAASLEACLDQASLVASLPPPATQPASAPATQPGDRITLRVETPDGRPAPDVFVSAFAYWAEGPFGPPSLQSVAPRPAVYTGADGVVTIPIADLSRMGGPPSALYALDRVRGLVAVTPLEVGDSNPEYRARLAPGISVSGSIGSVALEEIGRDVGDVAVSVVPVTPRGGAVIGYQSINRRFDLLLPPGDYHLFLSSENTEALARTIRLDPGSSRVELEVDLPPARIITLMGQPAPELDGASVWRGERVRLAGLRGKHVALCFWHSEGRWLTRDVPGLMNLRERYADRLEIVFIHTPMPGGLGELEARLAELRDSRWDGRELTLPLAIDEPTGRMTATGRRSVGLGRIAEAYGVNPGQVVLIDPDGRVRDRTTFWEAEGAIGGWLGTPTTQPADR